jgi:hypothetical protein
MAKDTRTKKTKASFWMATEDEKAKCRDTIETYLYLFNLKEIDFIRWLDTTAIELNKNIDKATVLELKALENECFHFCKVTSQGSDR